MSHDTLIEFDTRRRLRAEPTPPCYQPALSLQTGDLAAIRAVQHRTMLSTTRSWPETAAIWLALPPRALAAHTFPLELRGMLRGAGLAQSRVSLELPEAAAMAINPDGLLRLSALRDIGVGLILTEFGGSIASLSSLKRLPLTAMALSPVVVRGLPADREDAGLVRAAITVAHTLGLAVIADGVVSADQSAWLAGEGCTAGLGKLFGAPMSAQRLGDWLAGTCQPGAVTAIKRGD